MLPVIEMFHNRLRRLSTLGYPTPFEFEEFNMKQQVNVVSKLTVHFFGGRPNI